MVPENTPNRFQPWMCILLCLEDFTACASEDSMLHKATAAQGTQPGWSIPSRGRWVPSCQAEGQGPAAGAAHSGKGPELPLSLENKPPATTPRPALRRLRRAPKRDGKDPPPNAPAAPPCHARTPLKATTRELRPFGLVLPHRQRERCSLRQPARGRGGSSGAPERVGRGGGGPVARRGPAAPDPASRREESSGGGRRSSPAGSRRLPGPAPVLTASPAIPAAGARGCDELRPRGVPRPEARRPGRSFTSSRHEAAEERALLPAVRRGAAREERRPRPGAPAVRGGRGGGPRGVCRPAVAMLRRRAGPQHMPAGRAGLLPRERAEALPLAARGTRSSFCFYPCPCRLPAPSSRAVESPAVRRLHKGRAVGAAGRGGHGRVRAGAPLEVCVWRCPAVGEVEGCVVPLSGAREGDSWVCTAASHQITQAAAFRCGPSPDSDPESCSWKGDWHPLHLALTTRPQRSSRPVACVQNLPEATALPRMWLRFAVRGLAPVALQSHRAPNGSSQAKVPRPGTLTGRNEGNEK